MPNSLFPDLKVGNKSQNHNRLVALLSLLFQRQNANNLLTIPIYCLLENYVLNLQERSIIFKL
jgi:hypothetical protein